MRGAVLFATYNLDDGQAAAELARADAEAAGGRSPPRPARWSRCPGWPNGSGDSDTAAA